MLFLRLHYHVLLHLGSAVQLQLCSGYPPQPVVSHTEIVPQFPILVLVVAVQHDFVAEVVGQQSLLVVLDLNP